MHVLVAYESRHGAVRGIAGPLGSEPRDGQGRDREVTTIPKEIPELTEAVSARDHRVFYGADDPSQKPIGLAERFVTRMSAARGRSPRGAVIMEP